MFAIGLDLAWSPRNPSGLAFARRDGRRWRILGALAGLRSNEEILDTIDKMVHRSPVVMSIDAPLVVPNEARGREGDRLITRVFGPMEAGVYPATRRRLRGYGGARIWDLVQSLERHGFRHDCEVRPGREARVVFETYPHAALVSLLGLDRTLKYKAREGRSRRVRLRAFRALEAGLRDLRDFDPPLDIPADAFASELPKLRGRALKAYEDRLDAIICAYVAAYYWTWGTERCAIFGTLEGGYIVTPFDERLARRIPEGTGIFTYRPRTAPP